MSKIEFISSCLIFDVLLVLCFIVGYFIIKINDNEYWIYNKSVRFKLIFSVVVGLIGIVIYYIVN